ncbi:MAG: DUF1641 domain-containing protein [Methanomethylovorans sp.]|jgi:uncharacterized protein YjgD (DUF1641 family)|nr:DUF1641 domain-containing protein [Methanomethylovorans sp.]
MRGENNIDNISGIEITPTDVEAVLDLIRTAGILQNYINDETAHGIARLLSAVLKITNTIISTDFVDVVERGFQDPELDKALINPPKIGIGSLLKQTQDEDFQKGMGLMIELIKALGRATEDI